MDVQSLLTRFSKLRRARARLIEAAGVQTLLDFKGPWGLLDRASTGWLPSQNANRVIDLGCNGDVSTHLLTTPFEAAGLPRFFVYLDPYPVMSQAQASLRDDGYRMCNEVSVLVHNLNSVQAPVSSVTVREAGSQDNEDLQRVLTYEGTQEPMWEDKITGVLGRDGVAVFLAYTGDVPIAVGVLNWESNVAYLSNATTIPAYRGLGAQKALISARLQSAVERECDLAYVETYRFLRASFDNLIRAGFRELYLRPIYRYEFDPALRAQLEDTAYGHDPPY